MNKDIREINILGTKYNIKYRKIEEDKTLKEADGYIDDTSKEIIIKDENDNELNNFEELQKHSLRHEIIHGFLFESGLGHNMYHSGDYGHEEEIVDWFSIQAPKIYKIYQELEIL